MRPDPIKAELKSSFQRMRDAILLAGTGVILALPYLIDRAHALFPRLFEKPATPELVRLFTVFVIILYSVALLLIAMIGIYANQKAGLQPFKRPPLKKLAAASALGLAMIPAAYLLYDHLALYLIPELYPSKLLVAVLYPFSLSFPEELFARYGLLSLFAWIFGKSWNKRMLANVLAALLLTMYSSMDFFRLAPLEPTSTEIILFLFGAFLQQLIAGELYLKNGFWGSLAFTFTLSLKSPLYFFLFLNR